MKHNLPSNYRKYAEIARILGEGVEKRSIQKVAESSVECVKKLMEDIAMPVGLFDIGAEEKDIPELARESMKVQRLLKGNPRPVSQRDMEKILMNALRN
jgi:alcohol dehydrogenase class IV